MGVGSGGVDNLANAVGRTGLEGNVPGADLGEANDGLSSLLRYRNTSLNTKPWGDLHGTSFAREEAGRRTGGDWCGGNSR